MWFNFSRIDENDCFEGQRFNEVVDKMVPFQSPYGDFGWWTQNNGHQCFANESFHRDYCFETDEFGNETMLDHNNLCNWPRGTDGQQFHPYVEKEERLWIFQTDICRSLFMDFKVLY